MLEQNTYEIKSATHLMYAEGKQVSKPTVTDIKLTMAVNGYDASDIEIWFDDFMTYWCWTADIEVHAQDHIGLLPTKWVA